MKVRKSIKKPKFITTYLGSLVIVMAVLACMGLIVFYLSSNTYNTFAGIKASASGSDIQASIGIYLTDSKKITNRERFRIKELLASHYSETRQRFKVYFDKEEIADSSQTAIMYYVNDSGLWINNLELADKKYLEYFKTPELSKYWRTNSERYSDYYGSDRVWPKTYEGKTLNLIVWEAYIDLVNLRFIPVVCEVSELDNYPEGNLCGHIVNIPVENAGKIPEGYTLYKANGKLVCMATIEGFDGTDNESEYCNATVGSNTFGKTYGCKYTTLEFIPFTTAYKTQIEKTVWLSILGGIIFSLMPATIIYNVQRRKFEIFEYRRKMTDAMAHDLKSPMAAISAFAENLSDNIATDKREYYAGKIEEKVAQMNKMVNDILEFSKSENSPAAISKELVDIGEVVGKAVSDNEHAIDGHGLKINCDKESITIQTDLRLFSQAISNLIDNAVIYSKEGTDIDIAINSKKLVISNTPEAVIDNADKLKQPFVKGSTERGTNGSGLGLAIAENNLAMLGFKLDVGIDVGRFVATIKLK